MFFWIFKWSILSFILIFLIHYLYTFLINMLTVPKIRDLINKPQQQYNELLKNNYKTNLDNNDNDNNEEMCSELKKYVEELKITT
jgi:signal transduction histidine kinase